MHQFEMSERGCSDVAADLADYSSCSAAIILIRWSSSLLQLIWKLSPWPWHSVTNFIESNEKINIPILDLNHSTQKQLITTNVFINQQSMDECKVKLKMLVCSNSKFQLIYYIFSCSIFDDVLSLHGVPCATQWTEMGLKFWIVNQCHNEKDPIICLDNSFHLVLHLISTIFISAFDTFLLQAKLSSFCPNELFADFQPR